jgi:hypothetical protein
MIHKEYNSFARVLHFRSEYLKAWKLGDSGGGGEEQCKRK